MLGESVIQQNKQHVTSNVIYGRMIMPCNWVVITNEPNALYELVVKLVEWSDVKLVCNTY